MPAPEPRPRRTQPDPPEDLTRSYAYDTSDDSVARQAETKVAQELNFGAPVEPGEVGTLGPYRIVRQLGGGGMGAVYLAIDMRLDRKLALKVMLPEFAALPVAKERFLREARACAKVSNDNVVTVYEADERDGVTYIAMQFLQGYPLNEYLKKKGKPSIGQVIRIGRETALGLAAAHRIGLIHRDIKPANLWLEAPKGRIKVLDFGLAKPLDADVEVTKDGVVLGTPAYMSPEQARGRKLDARSDLFSLGAVLYQLCTGRHPFEGPDTIGVLCALASEDPRPVQSLNPAVPQPLAELIHQLLQKDLDKRPATADEVAQRLRKIAEELAQPSAQISIAALPEPDLFAGIDMASLAPIPAPVPQHELEFKWQLLVAAAVGALVLLIGLILATQLGRMLAKPNQSDDVQNGAQKDAPHNNPATP